MYERLPEADCAAAKAAFRQFLADPRHPSLRFKKLQRTDDVWSVRVTLSVRAVGQRNGDDVIWHWIGPHHAFDRAFK